MKDLLRFDTVVAACALLMSTVTAGAMVYQTRVLQDQFAATVWPYLAVNTDYGRQSVSLRLVNEGVGPALIRSAQVSVDGKPFAGWDDRFLTTVFGELPPRSEKRRTMRLADQSVDSSTAVRAGEERVLLGVSSTRPRLISTALRHDVVLDFCYCSINEKCWTLHASTKSAIPSIPQPVNACAQHRAIAAPLTVLAPAV